MKSVFNPLFGGSKSIVTLTLFLLLVVGFFVIDNSAEASSVNSEATKHSGRHISVIGHGEVTTEPDRATINLSVDATEKTSLAAKNAVDENVNRYIDGLLALGIERDAIVASVIYTQPQYEYQANGPRTLAGYRATRQLAVNLSDLSMMNDVMDLSLKEQINQINRIELTSSKSDELKRRATLLATANAKQQGEWLANAFGAQLGAIFSIDAVEPTNFEGMVAQPNATMMRMEASKRGNGQYIHEDLVFSSTVKAVFDLKVKD